MRLRSLLYVPAAAPRFVARAHERGADAIILDLEDSVAPADKDAARAALPDAVAQVGRAGAVVFVRVNDAGTGRMEADAEAACRAGARGLLVTKCASPATLLALDALLSPIEREPVRLLPVLEGPGAVLDARAIASAHPRVLALLTGGEDLATEMGAEPTPETLRLPKLMVHLAAKAAGVLSLGLLRGVADYRDTAGIAAAATEARQLGFDGATCVHPAVVPLLNAGFSPSPEAVARARRLLEAAATAGAGAFVFEGTMADRPIVLRARKLLDDLDGPDPGV